MSMVGFPLLLIPLAIYNIIVFLMPGVSFAEPLVKLTLMSGAEWPVTLSDMLLALGIVLLLLEVIKGARPGAKYLTDHLLSLIVFGAAAAEFRAVAAVRHLDLFPADACLRWWISCRALRCAHGAECGARQPLRSPDGGARTPAAAPEPQFDPAPAPSVPPAASVAESVLLDHPEPKIVHAEVTPSGPSPEVPSPGLQPGNGLAALAGHAAALTSSLK